MLDVKPTRLEDRYELRQPIGRGGMGVVYTAWDRLMQREVALKTLLEIENPTAREMFYKEWGLLSKLVHPNLISIYDVGEFEGEGGVLKPFFVMPLLTGATLQQLIQEGSPRLTVETIVSIAVQTARGLQAIHEQGLVHRDIKPANIWVMADDAVKIIDFGIAHLSAAGSQTTLKGTIYYMAPEQLQMKPPSPLTDQYSLGVVCYEALTRRRPFGGASENEVIQAILHQTPAPVCELNSGVGTTLGKVIQKAIARQPWHRFASAREFAEALQKALRNEPLECFDPAKIKPRLERAQRSFEQGDYTFAAEILRELEAEGHIEQEVTLLGRQLAQAMRRSRIQQLLGDSRRFLEAQEFSLALGKVQEALELQPDDADAMALRSQIERARRERKVEEWVQLAREHLENLAFPLARQALHHALESRPDDNDALNLLAEVDRREREVTAARTEKARLYQAAMQAWENGDVSGALSRLDVLLKMDRETPETDPGRSSDYQNFYAQVRTEQDSIRNAYEEARRQLAASQLEAASALCRQYLAKYPSHALFQALQYDIEDRKRQALSAITAETDRRVEQEPDLDRRVALLEEMLRQYPEEQHFERALRLARDKRNLLNSILEKARLFEERGQFQEALDQWQILRSIHEQYPGLSFEVERLERRREQQSRQQAKARWVELVERHLEGGELEQACRVIQEARAEFPGDQQIQELDAAVQSSCEKARQAQELVARARECSEKQSYAESAELLRKALALHPRSAVAQALLINVLMEQARLVANDDPQAAGSLVNEVLALRPGHPAAVSLANGIADRKREALVGWCLAQARKLQAEGDLTGAILIVDQGLGTQPNEPRLRHLRLNLARALPPPAAPEPPAAGSAAEPVAQAVVEAPAQELAAAPRGGGLRTLPARLAAAEPRKLAMAAAVLGVMALVLLAFVIRSLRVSSPVAEQTGREAVPAAPPTGAEIPAHTVLSLFTAATEGYVELDELPPAPLVTGGFHRPGLAPGRHRVVIRGDRVQGRLEFDTHAGAAPQMLQPVDPRTFPGMVVPFSGDTATVFSGLPDATASLDGNAPVAVPPDGLPFANLSAGTHQLVLARKLGRPYTLTLQVPGPPALTAVLPAPASARPPGFSLANWERAGGWQRRGGMLVSQAKGYILAPVHPVPGAYVFSAEALKGNRIIWVVDFRNDKNYCQFELDEKYFSRSQVINGSRSPTIRMPHHLGEVGRQGISTIVKADSISHRILRGERWAPLDEWRKPGADFLVGKFGFYSPGQDAVAVYSFQFTPE